MILCTNTILTKASLSVTSHCRGNILSAPNSLPKSSHALVSVVSDISSAATYVKERMFWCNVSTGIVFQMHTLAPDFNSRVVVPRPMP